MSPVPRFRIRVGNSATSTSIRCASSSLDIWETRYRRAAQRLLRSPHPQQRDEMKQTTRCAVCGAPKMILEANDRVDKECLVRDSAAINNSRHARPINQPLRNGQSARLPELKPHPLLAATKS